MPGDPLDETTERVAQETRDGWQPMNNDQTDYPPLPKNMSITRPISDRDHALFFWKQGDVQCGNIVTAITPNECRKHRTAFDKHCPPCAAESNAHATIQSRRPKPTTEAADADGYHSSAPTVEQGLKAIDSFEADGNDAEHVDRVRRLDPEHPDADENGFVDGPWHDRVPGPSEGKQETMSKSEETTNGKPQVLIQSAKHAQLAKLDRAILLARASKKAENTRRKELIDKMVDTHLELLEQIESGQGELDFNGEGKAATNGNGKPKRARKTPTPAEAFAAVKGKRQKAAEGEEATKKKRGRKPRAAEAEAEA